MLFRFGSPFVLGEDLQEEQEHVQDVQEDRRGQQRRGGDRPYLCALPYAQRMSCWPPSMS